MPFVWIGGPTTTKWFIHRFSYSFFLSKVDGIISLIQYKFLLIIRQSIHILVFLHRLNNLQMLIITRIIWSFRLLSSARPNSTLWRVCAARGSGSDVAAVRLRSAGSSLFLMWDRANVFGADFGNVVIQLIKLLILGATHDALDIPWISLSFGRVIFILELKI